MESTPFDMKCTELHERFQYLFEKDLINELCQVGELRSVAADELLMQIGQPITHMPLVVSGSLKVMTEDDQGEELLLYYLELGDTCAITLNCCSRHSKSAVTSVTEEPSKILFIPVSKMEEWMIKYASWRNFVLESYNSRLNEALQAIDNLAFNNMEERLTKYLRDRAMVLRNGEIKTTHQRIAIDLHSSRVVISRLMKKLEEVGIIKQHRNLVQVLEFMN